MAAVVRIEALRALAAVIAAWVPDLAGRICEGTPPSSEFEGMPNLSIQPARWDYEPDQAAESRTLPGNVVVWNVGRHSTPMVLSIVASTPEQRAQLEAAVIDLFLSQRHPLTGMPRPGILVVPVVACEALAEWLAVFEYESDGWEDANAFDRQYETRIIVTALIPALTIERPVYTISELRLALARDLAPQPTRGAVAIPTTELVTINTDGTISNA